MKYRGLRILAFILLITAIAAKAETAYATYITERASSTQADATTATKEDKSEKPTASNAEGKAIAAKVVAAVGGEQKLAGIKSVKASLTITQKTPKGEVSTQMETLLVFPITCMPRCKPRTEPWISSPRQSQLLWFIPVAYKLFPRPASKK